MFKPLQQTFFILFYLMTANGAVEYSDLEKWMVNLPEELKNVPLIYLAIPGSHDSMTYGITRNSGLAPDAAPTLKNLYEQSPDTMLRWTITQEIDALQQLLIGIRYFDLRLATKTGTNRIFFTHGAYAGEVIEPLRQIKEFLDSHAGEVVILDFKHFYSFTEDDHMNLINFITNMYGPQLVPRQPDMNGITLNTLDRLRQQVIIVYRHQSVYSTSEFWPSEVMPSPCPQQDNISGLYSFLRNVERAPDMGFVHQAVLTPTPEFILSRQTSNLKDECAEPVKMDLYPKLLDFSPGNPAHVTDLAPVNVVIADFVDLDDAIFPETIIQLNDKLLRNGKIPNSNGCGLCPTYFQKICAFDFSTNSTFIFDNECIMRLHNCKRKTEFVRVNYERCLFFGNFAHVQGLNNDDYDYGDHVTVKHVKKNPDFVK